MAPDPMTLKRDWGGLGKLNAKKKSSNWNAISDVLFHNIAALNIIDIVDRRVEYVWVTYSSPCGSPVVAKLQGGTFLRKEWLKQ